MTSGESEVFRNKMINERNPIDLRIGHMVCIKIAGSPSEFCRVGNCFQEIELFFYAFRKNQDLFTQAGRGGRLSVRSGEHGHRTPGLAVIFEHSNKSGKGR